MLYEKKLLLFDWQDLLFRQVLFHGMRKISYLILVKNDRSESLSQEQMVESLQYKQVACNEISRRGFRYSYLCYSICLYPRLRIRELNR
jgi:hypothetical protein